MFTAKPDVINEIVSRIRLSAWWIAIASISFGMEIAKVAWIPHDDFYPFPVLMWGAMTAISLFGLTGALKQLAYAVPPAHAEAAESRKRAAAAVSFGIVCVCLLFCFGLSVVASKRFGGIYPVVAAVLGILILWGGFLLNRRINRLVPSS
jgi:hypothetical protein